MRASDNLPWLVAGIFLLAAATFAGLLRIGWNVPLLSSGVIADHGPLMLTGFLGTLITLERAAATGRRYLILGAVFFALGGMVTLSGLADPAGKVLAVLGSLGLLAVFLHILRRHRAAHTWTMAAGAACLLVGSALWASGWSPALAAPWWAAFLVLTIAGERLELGRLFPRSSRSMGLFFAALGVYVAGVLLTSFLIDAGMRLLGAGMALLALWHMRFDVATRTVRKPGLTRFIAVCMLSGYAWLLVGGFLAMAYGAVLAGPVYDAQIHAVFLGFVFSMIFGHAPIIFPAILGRPIRFGARFYLHVGLLHASLLVRLWGDLLAQPVVRRWGGMLNAVTLLLFLLNTISALIPEEVSGERV